MKKNIKKVIVFVLCVFVLFVGSLLLYKDYRIKHAKVLVILRKPLSAEVFSKVKVSDFIASINGKLVRDYYIDTTKVGKKKVHFYFNNDENIMVSYTFEIEIKDTMKPIMSKRSSLNLYKDYSGNIYDNFFCGDNYDSNVNCSIIGDYDVNTVGSYPVTFEAVDFSGNKDSFNLNINIIENHSGTSLESSSKNYTNFKDVLSRHKDAKVGIDVSKWEGDIDFKKVGEEGVQFAYVRVGYQKEKNGEYIIDPYFKKNIEGFKNQNIKVGVYFFSKANSVNEAIRQANWVYRQIRGYNIDLEVVFDWENWEGFNSYGMSFYDLSLVADAFMNEIQNRGYKSMLYSSKFYLENVWPSMDDVWLAHYTDKTNYSGTYKVWQICEDGKIDGIEDMVDIDIMYD